MENNLKIVTMAWCANSFLRMQSFQIYNGRVLELKCYCEETLERRAAIIQSFWNKNEVSSRKLIKNLTKN